MKKILTGILFAFSVNAFAGIQVDATRVIYNSASKSASLSISNDSDDTYMVQTWLDTGDASQMPKNLPIVVTPPILKLAAKKAVYRRTENLCSGSTYRKFRQRLSKITCCRWRSVPVSNCSIAQIR